MEGAAAKYTWLLDKETGQWLMFWKGRQIAHLIPNTEEKYKGCYITWIEDWLVGLDMGHSAVDVHNFESGKEFLEDWAAWAFEGLDMS